LNLDEEKSDFGGQITKVNIFIQAEENKRLRELQLAQEEKLAVELAKLKHESLKDEKMRQQVRENRYLGFHLFHLLRLYH
jgi:hypothetical protein